LLIAAYVLRGVVQGMSQPLMHAILSNEVASNRHGASVGLRNAVVRLGSIITRAVMGVAAEAYGIENSFYLISGVFLLVTAGFGSGCQKSAMTRAKLLAHPEFCRKHVVSALQKAL